MPFIPLESLQIRKGMIAEQNILLAQFYAFFNSQIAAHRQILNVEEFLFIGAIAAEFLTYAATKMYLCLNFYIASNTSELTTRPYVTFYDYSNLTALIVGNSESHYDTAGTTTHFAPNYINLKNFYFSRLTTSNYGYMIFNGFRVTLN